jgi:L-methionine (R)-S-oxide reductase
MTENKKLARYERLYSQLEKLLKNSDNLLSQLATINAVLYHKMQEFFWIGFYLMYNNRLIVGPYQGPVACQELRKDTGVCWKGVNTGEAVVVVDVNLFPGHISCDSRSKSEIVVPLKDKTGRIIGVLDVDSKSLNTFDDTDAKSLEKILSLIKF